MPKRAIKKIRRMRGARQKKKDKKASKKKPKSKKIVPIRKKIEVIKEQAQRIRQERLLKRKERNLKKKLARFARGRKSLKGDYKTRFPVFGRGKDEDAQEVERYESKLSLEHQLELDLQRVEKALKRIQEGKYGFCTECGKKISPERLKIYPEAEYCVKCRQKKP